MSSEEEYEYTGLKPGALVKIESSDGFSGPHIILRRHGENGEWFTLMDQVSGHRREVFCYYVWRIK